MKDRLRRVELNDDVVDAVLEGGQHRGDGGSVGSVSISRRSRKTRAETLLIVELLSYWTQRWPPRREGRWLIIKGDKGHDDATDKQSDRKLARPVAQEIQRWAKK